MNGEQAVAPGSTSGAMAFPGLSAAPRDACAPHVSGARRRAAALLVAATLFLIFAGAEPPIVAPPGQPPSLPNRPEELDAPELAGP
jgi:hypothetical protein